MRHLRRLFTLIALFVVLGGASMASAHADLDSSDPSPSSVLSVGPSEIFLDFDEPVTTSSDSIELFDQAGASIGVGSAEVSPTDSTVVIASEVPPLADGLYVVAWRVVSADGHVTEGAFTFEVGAGGNAVDAGNLISSVLAGRDAQSGLGLGLAISRFIAYLATAIVAAGIVFMAVERRAVARLWKTIVWALGLLTVATLAHFVLQGPFTHGGRWSDVVNSDLWSTVLDTRLGTALVVRFVLVAGLAVLLMGVVPNVDRATRLSSSWWRSLCALLGVGTVLTFSASGHPSASELAGVSVFVDALHMSTVCLWTGGLVVVLIGGFDDAGRVRRFSRLATWLAPIAVLTGVWQVWHLAGGLAALGESSWGRLILVKVALAVGALTLGAVARSLVTRHDQTESSRRAMRRIMAVEVVIALSVFAATAHLVSEPPRAAASPEVYETTIAQGSIIASVTVTPGVVGNNEIHVLLSPTGGTLERMTSLTMRMTYPDSSLPPVAVPVAEAGPNHYVGNVALLSAGTWTLEILAQPDPSTSIRLTTEVPIGG
jgi:copper transport protein